ncbi:Adhesion G protein-coupled receptor L3 [Holothuria leucospilota]|uniref:Adhesion G protein-coupled receptor L3 n=1 Tax=Holothuria leucospilota TaxID=206669 RepID=A0A9Q1BF25_HOLLE|nr:Adhesion G protein-coupled receptor L3 [Holothuria leucospilota]
MEQTVVPISFFLYGNSHLCILCKPLEQVNVESSSNATFKEVISSKIISARIEDQDVLSTRFPDDSHVITKFITDSTLDIGETIPTEECFFWLYNERTGEGFWSNDGCNKMPDELDLTVCSYNRLGSFAVLVVRSVIPYIFKDILIQ